MRSSASSTVRTERMSEHASVWVERSASQVPPGPVLDVACGRGRHTLLFLELGHPVVAVDRDVAAVRALEDPRLEVIEADLENSSPFPLGDRVFSGVVVTNYLHRPLLPKLVDAVAPGGMLVYETFARGNERLGRPTSPAFLLEHGELLEVVRGQLTVIAYEDVLVTEPRPAAVQRIAAWRP